MKTLLTLAVVSIFFISCNSKKTELTLKESNSRINHLTIVIENNLWKGEIGDSLRNIIAAPVLGLPQEETQFTVNQVTPKAFSSLFQRNRNILFVGIDPNEGYYTKPNIFAAPQLTMTIFGKDIKTLSQLIQSHKEDIISVFKNSDLKLYQKERTENHMEYNAIKTFTNLNFKLNIPLTYAVVDDTGDFLWLRQDISKGSLNIIAYELPLTEKDSIAKNIVKARDTIGKNHIPGPIEGSYMATEAAFTPFIKEVQIDNKPAFETRGTWEVPGQFMAGPFLNYTILDKENNRILVIEGFTYAPSINKRDFMFELEAILKTLKI
ncbi:DUF4837 family protein [Aureibaculum marinum]|uniref:DUF4837 family protein n=1 Tax=Aureibaculum marinum TaxID=2487930 RepID=A0A3N4NWM2_9FLAO|nr:DUF4837 family protein [Aureibaculum marinum]RPE00236.1 DUF4837 family protein [Aureibaculum marinum]